MCIIILSWNGLSVSVCRWYVLQGEGTSSLVALRARSKDTPNPCEELTSPLTRGKRIATRNRGQGEISGADSSGTLPPLPKQLCLSLVGGPVRTFLTNYRQIKIQVSKFWNLLWNSFLIYIVFITLEQKFKFVVAIFLFLYDILYITTFWLNPFFGMFSF